MTFSLGLKALKNAPLSPAAELIEPQRMLIKSWKKSWILSQSTNPKMKLFVRGSHLDNAFASHLKNHPQPWLKIPVKTRLRQNRIVSSPPQFISEARMDLIRSILRFFVSTTFTIVILRGLTSRNHDDHVRAAPPP